MQAHKTCACSRWAALCRCDDLDEYRQFIEKDAALERQFPKSIGRWANGWRHHCDFYGLKERYELHHGVDIQDSAIAAARMSHRYITDRKLPDKAIDLIDEAASRLRMEMDSKPGSTRKLDSRLIQLKMQREVLKNEEDAGRAVNVRCLIAKLKS